MREIAKLMSQEWHNRMATGQSVAMSMLDQASTLDTVQSLEAGRWTYAKTMPRIPHWYCPWGNWQGPVSYHVAMGVIRTRGVKKRWGPYHHPYLHANGWKYWVMCNDPVEETPVPLYPNLINRARNDEEPSPFDRLSAGGLPELADEHAAAMTLDLHGSVLDIGVGEGWLTRRVPPERYMGIECSYPMMTNAAAACPQHAHRMIACRLADFHKALKFDTVAAFGTASYLSENDWAKAWRLVAPHGRLVATWLKDPLPLCSERVQEPRRAVEQMRLREVDGVVVGEARRDRCRPS